MLYFQYDAHILPQITLIGEDTRTGPHRNIRRISDDYIFYLITEGEMFFTEGETEYHLQKGDCFLFEPGMLHFGNRDTCYQIRYIHFYHPSIERIQADSPPRSAGTVTIPKCIHIHDTVVFQNLLAIIAEAITRNYTPFLNYDILCACSVQHAFLELHRLSSCNAEDGLGFAEQHVRTVLDYLHGNYSRKLTGAVLEKELSYDFDYLNQLFRRVFHTSIFQSLESIRMEAARNLIVSSNLSVEQIAVEVGYKDAAYFSKVFKKHTGLSPLKYRQTALR